MKRQTEFSDHHLAYQTKRISRNNRTMWRRSECAGCHLSTDALVGSTRKLEAKPDHHLWWRALILVDKMRGNPRCISSSVMYLPQLGRQWDVRARASGRAEHRTDAAHKAVRDTASSAACRLPRKGISAFRQQETSVAQYLTQSSVDTK
jgi:hypothetical protein